MGQIRLHGPLGRRFVSTRLIVRVPRYPFRHVGILSSGLLAFLLKLRGLRGDECEPEPRRRSIYRAWRFSSIQFLSRIFSELHHQNITRGLCRYSNNFIQFQRFSLACRSDSQQVVVGTTWSH
eukprot:scaffold139246_cov19-Prasinocladus_malaysianus.AAC.1